MSFRFEVACLSVEYSDGLVIDRDRDRDFSRPTRVRKARRKVPKEKKTHPVRNFFIALLMLAFIIVNALGLYVGNMIYTETSIRHAHLNESNLEKYENTVIEGKADNNWKDVAIQSPFGYTLNGTFVPNPSGSNKTVIFLHGFGENRLAGIKYLPVYLNDGFNVLLVDQRAQGSSGGESITWGEYEKKDLDQWITWLKTQYPDGQIGVHGVSMGAVVALLHAGINETNMRVSFYVADSPYTDLQSVIADQAQTRYGLYGVSKDLIIKTLLLYANIVAYAKGHFTYSESAPINMVGTVNTPILYIHGQNDKLVPYQMSEELYNATNGPKEIYLSPGTGHVASIYKSPRKYSRVVRDFIDHNT